MERTSGSLLVCLASACLGYMGGSAGDILCMLFGHHENGKVES